MRASAQVIAAGLVTCCLSGDIFAPRIAAAEPLHPSHPAVAALVETARAQVSSGHMSQAAATLERALNIDSRDPRIWHWLARVRYRQGRVTQAEQLALKSISLTQPGRRLQFENWQLVARARTRQGDDGGAERARSEAGRQADD